MDKTLFITTLNVLKNQYDKDKKVANHLGKAFPDAFEANLLPDNHLLTSQLILLLQSFIGDTEACEMGQTWIEWYIYETEFGSKDLRIHQNFENHSFNIRLKSASDLYHFLSVQKKSKEEQILVYKKLTNDESEISKDKK